MTAHEHLLTATRRIINEFSAGHRIVGLTVVLVVVMLGTAQWMQSSRDTATLDSAQQESQVSNAAEQFVYFPGQYVNQATEPTEHIQAF